MNPSNKITTPIFQNPKFHIFSHQNHQQDIHPFKNTKKKSQKFSNPRKYKTLTIYFYLSSMRKACEKITLLHPGKQVPDPQRPDLLGARILLGRVLGLSLGLLRCRHGLLGPTRLGLLLLLLLLLVVLRRHHHPLLLLRHRLLVLLLRLIRRLGLRDHAGSWLLHHDDDGVFYMNKD